MSISKLTPQQRQFLRLISIPFSYFITFIDFIYPKNKKIIFIGSEEGEFASGSPKKFYNYLKSFHPNYEVTYYQPFKKDSNNLEQIKYILKLSHKFFRAKFLISSHPPTDFFPFIWWSKRKVFINFWHGIPIKAIFFADSYEKSAQLKRITQLNNKTDVFIVSSNLEASLISRCFLIESSKIYFTGQPKNDEFININNTNYLDKYLTDVPNYDKVILYCPTYRRESETEFFPFQDFDTANLNKFLEDNNLIILIRGHIFDKKSKNELFSDRIIDFGFEICEDVYDILNNVDIMLTDYSSIYIDFLLLNKPFIFIPYDLEEYKEKRGLLFDDYDFWAPGAKILSYNEFIKEIKELLSNNDKYEKRRKILMKQFHYYQTCNSSELILKIIKKWE